MITLAFAAQGDKDKFEYLYEKYKRLLWHKAYDILKDSALAEDAVSESFIRVYRNLGKVQDVDSSKTIAFLVTIVKNIAIYLYNREKRAAVADMTEFETADVFDLETYVVNKDMATQVMGLLDKLSEELRSVFLLKYAHDLSHKEIGKILGITENNVTVRLHRAKTKIIRLMREVQ